MSYVVKENWRLCFRIGWRNGDGDVATFFSLCLSDKCVRQRRVKQKGRKRQRLKVLMVVFSEAKQKGKESDTK